MKILVTGSQGYIGCVLVPMLLKEGHQVLGFDSDLYRQCTFVNNISDIPVIRKDVRDVQISDLEGFDAILHLAGLSNDPLGDLNPQLTYQINHKASLRLAKLAKKAGIKRFIFSSSCSNYGAAGDKMVNEKSEFHPVTPYGDSKVQTENDVSKLADDKFSPVFLRNATAYGISPRLRFDLVLNNLVAWAYTTKLVYLKSDGTPWRPIVHIEDISRAFIAALHAPSDIIHNQAFNVGINEENYQIRDLAEIVKNTVPGCKIEHAKGAGPDKRCYRVDCNKLAQTLPEFKPEWNAIKGAQQLYNVYSRVGLTLDEFEGPKYQRVGHIKYLLATGQLDKTLRWKVSKPEQISHILNENAIYEKEIVNE